MQKRRERIERWRAERKKKELDSVKKDVRTTIMCKSYKYIKCNFNVLHFNQNNSWSLCGTIPQNTNSC